MNIGTGSVSAMQYYTLLNLKRSTKEDSAALAEK